MGIKRTEHGIEVRFLARPSGLGSLLSTMDGLLVAAPLFVLIVLFGTLSALHDEAGIGPDFSGRAAIAIAASGGLYGLLRVLFRLFDRHPQVQLSLRHGVLETTVDGHSWQASLEQVRLELAEGVLTVSGPTGQDVVRPLQPELVRSFVDEVVARQREHGDGSEVPEALRRRLEKR